MQISRRHCIITRMEEKSYVNKNIYDLSYTMRKSRARRIRNAALTVILFFVVMNAILIFCASPIKQSSSSMEPNVMRDSFLLSTPIALYSENKIRRGEIVLVERPEEKPLSIAQKAADTICRAFTLQKIHPFTKEAPFLSRIAAVPGDTIYMRDFVLYVTPKDENFSYTEFELNQIPYSIDIRVPPVGWNTRIGVRGNFEKTTLKDDEYFVLADDRLASMDSRIFGAVKQSRIRRKVVLSYFPLNSLRLFRSKANK